MTLLERFKQSVSDGDNLRISNQLLALTYLELHRDNPALHPDGWFEADSGYQGYQAIIMYEADQALNPETCPEFKYPTWLTQPGWNLIESLKNFHADDTEGDALDQIIILERFWQDLTTDLGSVLKAIDFLIGFHEGAPEEIAQQMEAMQKTVCFVYYGHA